MRTRQPTLFVGRVGLVRRVGLVGLMALGLMVLSSCSKKQIPANVLATVGSRQITTEDFQRELQYLQNSRRPLPDKEQVLQQMIQRELRLQKARAAGLENDPEVRRRYEAMLVAKIDERELAPEVEKAAVSPEEIRAEYEKEIAKHTRPAKSKLALIYIKTDPKMSPEKLSELETRISEARQLALKVASGKGQSAIGRQSTLTTSPFATIAIDYSDDQASRYKGGDVGWFDQARTEYRWPTQVVSAGFALTNGGISEVIKADNGFYIVSKLDSRDPVITPLQQVQHTIQRRLLADKRDQTEAAYHLKLRAFVPVQTHPDNFAKIQYPAAAVAKAEEKMPPMLGGTTVSKKENNGL